MATQHYDKDPSWKENKKFSKFLSEGEEIELVTGYSSIYFRQKFIIHLMFPGMIFIIAGVGYTWFTKTPLVYGLIGGLIASVLFSIFLTWITKISHKYLLTSMRVIVREGIINLKVNSVMLDKITHIKVDQGLMDRLFLHHGTIVLYTAGGSHDELILRFVEQPLEFKSVLERLIRIERRFMAEETTTTSLIDLEQTDSSLLKKL